MEEFGALYLVSAEVWQTAQHSKSLTWILLLPQFEQQNRNHCRDLQTHTWVWMKETPREKQWIVFNQCLRLHWFLVLLLDPQVRVLLLFFTEEISPVGGVLTVESCQEMAFRHQKYSTTGERMFGRGWGHFCTSALESFFKHSRHYWFVSQGFWFTKSFCSSWRRPTKPSISNWSINLINLFSLNDKQPKSESDVTLSCLCLMF